MTEEQLRTIENRASAASDPPWQTDGYPYVISHYKGRCTVADCSSHAADKVHHTTRQANAEFIAHAREGIPQLVSEIRRLQELLSEHGIAINIV